MNKQIVFKTKVAVVLTLLMQMTSALGDVKWSWNFLTNNGSQVTGALITDGTYADTTSGPLHTFTILSFESVAVDGQDLTPSNAFPVFEGQKQFKWDTVFERVDSVVGANGTIVTNTENFQQHLQLVLATPDAPYASMFKGPEGSWWTSYALPTSSTQIRPVSNVFLEGVDEPIPPSEPLILSYFETGNDPDTGAQTGVIGGLNFGTGIPSDTDYFKVELYLSNTPVVLENRGFDETLGQLTVGLPYYHAQYPGTYLLTLTDFRNDRTAKMHVRIPAPDGFIHSVDLRRDVLALKNNVFQKILTVKADGFSGPAQIIFAPFGLPRNGGFLKRKGGNVDQITMDLARNNTRESYVQVLHKSQLDPAQNVFLNPYTSMIVKDVQPNDSFSIRVKVFSEDQGAVTFGGGQLVLVPITR